MRELGPDAMSVVGLTRVLLFQYAVVCTVESLSLFYLLLYLDLYVLEDDTSIS